MGILGRIPAFRQLPGTVGIFAPTSCTGALIAVCHSTHFMHYRVGVTEILVWKIRLHHHFGS